MMLSEDHSKKPPKKKRGRPKGTKNKTASVPKKEAKKVSSSKAKLTAAQMAAMAEAEARSAAARLAAAKTAAEEEAEKEYAAAAAEVTVEEVKELFTNKRGKEQIFRYGMDEPEFWLGRENLAPPLPILTPDEEQDISRNVQIPTNQTPSYNPQHILSPEFNGVSNYERAVDDIKQEFEEKLQQLKANPESSSEEIAHTEEDLKTLDYLYENYYDGMNVFRTAKGGRDKLRE